jgi:iron complex outermembrane recepter protein
MPRCYLLIVIFLLCAYSGLAQQKISIKVVNKNNEVIPYASVSVARITDSSRSTTRTADSLGLTSINLQSGKYRLIAKAISYKESRREIMVEKPGEVFIIELSPESTTLQGVVVTARKPLLRQEDDKTIVDPEPIVLGSTNAYEVMEKIPGLFVDQDGNVYLNSTTPSMIWINGREQRMSTADVATLLKSLPPNSIASIEIIRSPSARYDASGGGGIVNVILKKNVKIGMTGSINGGMNQGKYGNQFLGLSINNNNGKLTTYVNLNFNNRNSFEEIRTDRFISTDTKLSQLSFTKYPGYSSYIGFGVAYDFSKKWELAADTRINLNKNKSNNYNLSEIITISTDELESSNKAEVSNNGNNGNLQQGLNLKYKIDSLGSEWVTDLSYNYGKSINDQDLLNTGIYPQIYTTTGIGDFGNHSNFFTAQTNLIKKFKNKLTVETGLKSSNIWFDNKTEYFSTTGGTPVPDPDRSNAYHYDEHIHAAYLQASKPLAGFVLKAGLRVENTNMNGRQTFPGDTSFSIHRTDAFPYIYLSRNLMKMLGYDLKGYLIYRRTISRPSYSYLNPSIRIIDPYLYETGNPALRPQFTQNYEANISVDERPVFAIGFNDTKDIFSQVIYQSDSNQNIAYRTYDNLGSNKETYFRVMGALPPGKKYFFVLGMQYNHNFYNGLYEGDPLTFKRGSYSFFTYHNFRLRPTTNFSFYGFVRLNGQLQFYELGNFGSLNLNVSQQFLQKKLTITAGMNDMFYTNWNTFFIEQGSLKAEGYRKADTRRFTLNFRYNFGIRKKEEKTDEYPTENQ